MVNIKNNIRIKFSHKLKYAEDINEYTIQMKRDRNPWWLLLFLLPLLLLIQCHKDITVSCYEQDTMVPIEDLPVKMEYESHYLWNNGGLFATDSISLIQHTDSVGRTVFKDLPCSVFGYIFYCLNQVSFTAKNDCHAVYDEKHNFHFTQHVDMVMSPRREDVYVKLLDMETGDVLPDAVLYYKYAELEEEKNDSAHADAAGIATLSLMRYCSIIGTMKGCCYGYESAIRADVPCRNLLVADDSMALRLRPIKQRFTFFVKNKETHQLIPDAICKVKLTYPKGKIMEREVCTSIDGKGLAVYDSAFVLSNIAIHASKTHYYDGDLEGEGWTVEKFVKQKDSIRTIWLVPKPYLVEFVNVDSIIGRPIPGVKNRIKIIDPAGKIDMGTEISNHNGVFPVMAKEGSRVEIVSTKDPIYKKKQSVISKFKDKAVIRMTPNRFTLTFRTVTQHDGTLNPDCALRIRTSSGQAEFPTNSGNGVFEVKNLSLEEKVYIDASKGFVRNNTKVNGQTVSFLADNASLRDIPLPVTFEYKSSDSGDFYDNFDLTGKGPYRFRLDWIECCLGDCSFIEIFAANGACLAKVGTNGNPATSAGSLNLISPSRKVRIHVQDKNGHVCHFRIIRL